MPYIDEAKATERAEHYRNTPASELTNHLNAVNERIAQAQAKLDEHPDDAEAQAALDADGLEQSALTIALGWK